MQLLSATLSLNLSGRLYTWLIRNAADYPYVIYPLPAEFLLWRGSDIQNHSEALAVVLLNNRDQETCNILKAEFEWEEARREAEAFAGEDIEELLARVEALEMKNAQLRDSMEVAVDLIGDIYSLAHRNVLLDLSGEGSIVDLARAASKCLLAWLLNEEKQ